MGKKYLIYVDILGFEELAKEIAKDKRIGTKAVRKHFIDIIKEKVKDIETKHWIIGKHYGGSDDWILVADSLVNVFRIISEILDHDTEYEKYENIPLEIGVGTAKFDKQTRIIEENLIIEDEIIEFLKTRLFYYYHDWYRKHEDKGIKSTYIVFTESAYQELEPLDKKIFKKIKYTEEKPAVRFFIADLGRFLQRGKIFDFLDEIGYLGSRLYGRIDEVYVFPVEFSDIQNTLKEKRIVFITGTQEYGKTYTAVQLLWEYFCGGYGVEWVRGEEKHERAEVRKWLKDIRAKTNPHRIVYFEDPFGRTKYEKREYLEKEIGTIIESVRNAEDSYVVITSREEVFKEFEKDNLSAVDIKEFEEKLNLMRPSYDYEKRKEIVTRWAEEENCVWINNNRLKTIVLNEIKDEKKLTTPLKMRAFAVATVNTNEEDILREKIKKKSEETAKAFAEEIRNMTWDKIVFLSLFFVSRFTVDFLRNIYEEMVVELQLVDASDFDEILSWFKDDKVRVGDYVEFSHPSYSEALKYLIGENGSFRREYRGIFGRNLLFKLADKDETVGAVAMVVSRNFDKFPDDVKNLLFTLAEKDRTAWHVVEAVIENFDKLPDNVRNRLLSTLAEKDRTAWHVAMVVSRNFDKLPDNVRNRLLLTLAEKDRTAGAVVEAVARNFDKLPDNVRNLLFKLADKDEVAWYIVLIVMAENFDSLPENMRNFLLPFLPEIKLIKMLYGVW